MPLFSTLIFKIAPLYANIFLGFIAGRYLDANRETVAKLMFYIFSPFIIFNGVIHTDLDASILSLPLITFTIATTLCIFFYSFSRKIWSDSSKNILAFTAGSGNTGYFGLPVALMLLEDQGEGIYIMALLGITLFENTVGYYICVKGTCSYYDCLKKFISLPALYAFILGLILNLTYMEIPEIYFDFMGHIKGAYIVLGMMIIGLGLSRLSMSTLDFKFIGITFCAKFIAWPLIAVSLILLDVNYLHCFSEISHQVLFLISIVPLAVNSVIIASLLKCQPEKTATAVLLSTILALLYVPFMAGHFFK